MPLSIWPSQSLSLLSQTSGIGPWPLHTIWPLTQMFVPGLHSPTLLPQGPPIPGRLPSSTMPLQSLSTPSHVSGAGFFEGVHVQLPPTQISEPLLHGGASEPLPVQVPPGGGHQVTSGLIIGYWQQLPGSDQQPFMPAGGPSPSGGSSIVPLQLLSMPSQT